MSKKIPNSFNHSEPIPIPGKTTKESKHYSKSAPSEYYGSSGFFVGSPNSGLSIEQSKYCEQFLLELSGQNPVDESKDSTPPQLTGEQKSEDE